MKTERKKNDLGESQIGKLSLDNLPDAMTTSPQYPVVPKINL